MTRERTLDVLIVEDHPITRTGLRDLLDLMPVVGKINVACNAEEGWDHYLKFHPTFLLLDVDLPKASGIDLAEQVLRADAGANVILLTNAISNRDLYRAKHLKVRGILLKSSAVTEIEKCIITVAQGGQYYSRDLLQTMELAGGFAKEKEHFPSLETLTAKERVVLKLISEDMSTKEIASKLNNSPETIKNHRKNICRKLALQGNYSLLGFAMKYKYAI